LTSFLAASHMPVIYNVIPRKPNQILNIVWMFHVFTSVGFTQYQYNKPMGQPHKYTQEKLKKHDRDAFLPKKKHIEIPTIFTYIITLVIIMIITTIIVVIIIINIL